MERSVIYIHYHPELKEYVLTNHQNYDYTRNTFIIPRKTKDELFNIAERVLNKDCIDKTSKLEKVLV